MKLPLSSYASARLSRQSYSGEPLVAIIVEPQGRDEPTKKFSWPVYVAVVRRVLRCQYAFLLVVCPDPVEAAKCREVIRAGHPGFDLAPAVIDAGNTPGAGDASPYLTLFAACMGAIDMTDQVGARHVLSAINDTGATLEALMSTIDWTTHPFIESFKKEGIEEGTAATKAEDILKLIDARGIEVTKEQRGQVTASAGLAKLDAWFDRALTATTAEDIFRG